MAHIHIIHHIHMYIHIFISSALRGWLAALYSLCPIQDLTEWRLPYAHYSQVLQIIIIIIIYNLFPIQLLGYNSILPHAIVRGRDFSGSSQFHHITEA